RIGNESVSLLQFNDAASIQFSSLEYYNGGVKALEICDAGTYTIKAVNIIGNEYFNRNYNYTIVDNNEEFVVNKRTVLVSTANLSPNIYNNTLNIYPESYMKLTYTNGLISQTIVTNEQIKLFVEYYDENDNVATPINAGNYYIKAVGVEVDADYAKNHDVVYSDEKSTFTILKRDVVIAPASLEAVVYDGTIAQYPNTQFSVIGGLGEYEDSLPTANITISVEYKTALGLSVNPIDAGIYNMYVSGVYGDYANYNISYSNEAVTFEILKRDIVIEAAKIENVVYGEDFIYDNAKYVIVKDNNEDTRDTYLRYGGNLSVVVSYKDEDGNTVNPINVGKYYIDILDWYCDNEHNYNIIKSNNYSEFEITPRAVTIKAQSDSIIFNNEEYIYNKDSYVIYDTLLRSDLTNLYKGEALQVEVLFKMNGDYYSPINAGTYDIEISNLICDEQTLINYDIELSKVLGKLEILKRDITLSPVKLESKVYKASAYEYDQTRFDYEYTDTQPYPNTDILKNDINANITVDVEFR
ncbi:MAG: hypothetical protein J6R47_01675, partial [Acholeplasmatales bacterium]|nr:hypothetical protein [Acholeplasmatales bacterium]